MPAAKDVSIRVNLDTGSASASAARLKTSLDGVRGSAGSTSAEQQKLQGATDKVGQSTQKFKRQVDATSQSLIKFATTVRVAAAALTQIVVQKVFTGVQTLFGSLFSAPEELRRAENTFAAILKNTNEARDAARAAREIAVETGVAFKTVSDSLIFVSQGLRGFGKIGEDATQFVANLSNFASSLGLESSRVEEYTKVITQALQQTTLLADQFITLRANAGGAALVTKLLAGLSKEVGVQINSINQLRIAEQRGIVTSEDLANVITKKNFGLVEGDKAYRLVSEASGSLRQSLIKLVTNFSENAGVSSKLVSVLDYLANNLVKVATKATLAAGAITAFLIAVNARSGFKLLLSTVGLLTSRFVIMGSVVAGAAVVILAVLPDIIRGFENLRNYISKFFRDLGRAFEGFFPSLSSSFINFSKSLATSVSEISAGIFVEAGNNFDKYINPYIKLLEERFSSILSSGDSGGFASRALDTIPSLLATDDAGGTKQSIKAQSDEAERLRLNALKKRLEEERRQREAMERELERQRKAREKELERQRLEAERQRVQLAQLGASSLAEAGNVLRGAFEEGADVSRQLLKAAFSIAANASRLFDPTGVTGSFISTAGSFFQTGGYTGSGGSAVPAGVVHKNEFVLPSDVTSKLLDGVPVNVGASPKVTIVNVSDMSVAERYLQTREGETAILNVIKENNLVTV